MNNRALVGQIVALLGLGDSLHREPPDIGGSVGTEKNSEVIDFIDDLNFLYF